jgi:hypothetical protein
MLLPLALLFAVTLSSAPLLSASPDRILLLRIAPSHADLYISNADGYGEHPLAPCNSLDYIRNQFGVADRKACLSAPIFPSLRKPLRQLSLIQTGGTSPSKWKAPTGGNRHRCEES